MMRDDEEDWMRLQSRLDWDPEWVTTVSQAILKAQNWPGPSHSSPATALDGVGDRTLFRGAARKETVWADELWPKEVISGKSKRLEDTSVKRCLRRFAKLPVAFRREEGYSPVW